MKRILTIAFCLSLTGCEILRGIVPGNPIQGGAVLEEIAPAQVADRPLKEKSR